MNPHYILAIDQGTTSSRALIINHQGEIVSLGQSPFKQHFPESGWVEHDLDDIWNSTVFAIKEAIKNGGISERQIAAIGITNQRETSCAWNKNTGEALHRAIVWQDRRTSDRCLSLQQEETESYFQKKTGLLVDPYFSATKYEWLLQTGVSQTDLALGTIDSFLVSRLSNQKFHVTDVTNASRTLLMNLETLEWDSDLLSLFGIPQNLLPDIVSSSQVIASTEGLGFLPDGIAISGLIGDQQSALLGQCCFSPHDAKCTLGTGAFILINTGSKPIYSKHRLLTTVAWKINSEITYALEGSAFIAGAAIDWLRDGLNLIRSARELDQLASQVPNSAEVSFIPALTGLGAPHWKSEARGMFKGLTRGTTRAHIARAVLEGIALEITDLIDAMEQDMNHPLSRLQVDGGVSKSNFLLQTLSDLISSQIIRPQTLESTALGAAYMAGLGIDFWPNLTEIKKFWKKDCAFTPGASQEAVVALKRKWIASLESL